jgi:multiple sugar transport system substrate-binding protein
MLTRTSSNSPEFNASGGAVQAHPDAHQILNRGMTRRSLFRAAALVGGVAAAPSLLSACGGSSSSGSTNHVTFGSNNSDGASRSSFQALMGRATKVTGVSVEVNTSDHDTFQNNISNYLQATPDDLFTWFSGYRMRYFAAQGLVEPIDDVWDKIGHNFGAAEKNVSRGADGHFYLVPFYTYPWVVFYNKSEFRKRGYEEPTTWDQFIALAKRMKTDGITPIAFGNKDLWPSLGTFDILNMRINGYDYHMSLLSHDTPWTDPGVTAVFDHWRELMPYVQSGANGRDWQDAAKSLETKKAGMMYQGTAQVAANYAAGDLDDLDFFLYPEINPAYGQDFMDAPTDGFMMPRKAKNKEAGKKILEYLGTPKAENLYLRSAQWEIGAASGANEQNYNAIQRKSVEVLAKSKKTAQFMDTDTVPAMATAMEQLIQRFIDDPTSATVKKLQASAEAQAKGIFA